MTTSTRGRPPELIGVVHLPPLPTSPFYPPDSLSGTIDRAVLAAKVMEEGGMDGVLLQTAERVYSTEDWADPARVAAMTICADRVRAATGPTFVVGVQIMRHAVKASIAVAKMTDIDFVRVDALVGVTLSTHGLVQPKPLEIMSYRKLLEAFDVRLIADIDSMHFQWPGNPTVGRVAQRAMDVGADAVCLAQADDQVALQKVAEVREMSAGSPIYLGGFVTHQNAGRLLAVVDGAFVAGCLSSADHRSGVSLEKVRELTRIATGLDT